MARIDTKNIPDSLKLLLEKEAIERSISLNRLTTEIFEDYANKRYSFEGQKKFTESLNSVTIALNKNTETLEKYIQSNIKIIDLLTD